MKAETAYYRIGGLVLRVDSALPFDLETDDMRDFRIGEAPADYAYRFQPCSDLPEMTGETRVVNEYHFGYDLLGKDGGHFRALGWKGRLYDVVLSLGADTGVISYLSEELMAERREAGFLFPNYLALEHLFYRFGGLFLHSSHVSVGGRALLFSAPSGTGKSTQADLWEKYAGGEIINGDRTLLRKKDGVWHAYGCPMCGTSGIHKQGCEPIHAIVMLSQGKENTVKRLTPGEAFQRIYPEITVPRWNRELVLRAMELLDDVMARVPIYALSCTPDERAVTALREAIGL